MRVYKINSRLTFTRQPYPEEEPKLQATCNKAFDALGAKERIIITHGSCFPSETRDSYIGSPFSNAAKKWVNFLMLYGFNGNQLGPNGELEKACGKVKPSPYNSSAFAKNKLFIDLEQLSTSKYANILSIDTLLDVTREPKTNYYNYDLTNFDKASETYERALSESFRNFKIYLASEIPEAVSLNEEYIKFLDKHNSRLTDEGIFKVLSKKHNTDDFRFWNDYRDENLITNVKNGETDAINYYDELKKYHRDEIEQYKFEQFLATKQIKENKEWRNEFGFKYYNDLLVGCSQMDQWRYKEAFLQDWEMGAKENNSRSQRWCIPVIDPKKIFKNDKYELNIGGKFLKEKIEFALEFNENIRIDHAMGLIEPYILSKHATDDEFSEDENKNENVEKYISELKTAEGEEYDHYWDYPKLLTKLIIPSLKEHGITPDMPVWEDICSYPARFKEVYENQLNLPKIINLDWARAQEAVKTNRKGDWYLVGSHDNQPAMTYLDRIGTLNDGSKGKYTRTTPPWSSDYLAGYLNMDNSRKNINEIRRALTEIYEKDDKAIVRAKFTELMTTPKFQISFADLLGITDISYNIGGSKNDINWKERISADYLDQYYENLSSENPTALNIPELLKNALQAKIDMKVVESNYNEEVKAKLYEKYQPLLNDLQEFADILKE